MTTDLANITLAQGKHDGNCDDPQRCFWEWYNHLVRQHHGDDCPPGVSPVLHAYGMRLNDTLPHARRQELKRFLPNGSDRLAGTASDGKDETRGYIALDWLIRTYLPEWLDLARLTAEAAALRDLRRIAGLAAAKAARPAVQTAYDNAYKATRAAWAEDAAWAAGAAGAAWAAGAAQAAGAAGAAWAAGAAQAAGAAGAAWAAGAAQAAGAAWAEDAAWAAGAAGAAQAAGAAGAAGDAEAALKPAVDQLQQSAIDLYDVLIAGEWSQPSLP